MRYRQDTPALDLPYADRANRNYLETCRRLGVDPVPRDRAQDLITEWSDALAAGPWVPPTTHWRRATPGINQDEVTVSSCFWEFACAMS